MNDLSLRKRSPWPQRLSEVRVGAVQESNLETCIPLASGVTSPSGTHPHQPCEIVPPPFRRCSGPLGMRARNNTMDEGREFSVRVDSSGGPAGRLTPCVSATHTGPQEWGTCTPYRLVHARITDGRWTGEANRTNRFAQQGPRPPDDPPAQPCCQKLDIWRHS